MKGIIVAMCQKHPCCLTSIATEAINITFSPRLKLLFSDSGLLLVISHVYSCSSRGAVKKMLTKVWPESLLKISDFSSWAKKITRKVIRGGYCFVIWGRLGTRHGWSEKIPAFVFTRHSAMRYIHIY